MKVSDWIAQWMARKGVKHLFCISGAGNAHLLDSVARQPELIYICPHHEQAGAMAAIAYHRISLRPAVMITTAGPGAINALSGVLDAWADSMPLVVISGQEKAQYAKPSNPLRMWGVQGTNITLIVRSITKYAVIVDDPSNVQQEFEKAFYIAQDKRPGPVWLDIPMDVQAADIDEKKLEEFRAEAAAPAPILKEDLQKTLMWLRRSRRPVILIGQGVRIAGASHLISELMRRVPVPYLTAWNGADLISSYHDLHFGHAGTYGQRCANFVVQNSDLLISIGSRLAIPQIGYDFKEFARSARKVIVDIDPSELSKFEPATDLLTLAADARHFMESLLELVSEEEFKSPEPWIAQCKLWRERYPLFDPSIHRTSPGFVNSYEFIDRLSRHFSEQEVIVTDMGAALTCTHQAVRLDKRQRLVTSTGLGEMGFGLPGAIGACFANENRRVLLVIGDGSIMMNLQELQTIVHHQLPIKIFLYVNDAYLTIRHTQTALFGDRHTASGALSGVSCPDFRKVAEAFGIQTVLLDDSNKIDETIDRVLSTVGPALCEIRMHPTQPLIPKLSFSIRPDGSLVSPPIEDLYPFLSRRRLKEEMIIDLHPKSEEIQDENSSESG